MSLPLQTLSFYRLPTVTCTGIAINNLLDAIHSALSQTSDFRGASLPSTHLWTWSRFQNAGTTEAVYTNTPPSGTPMTRTPAIIFAGASGAKTITNALNIDSYLANSIMVGMNLRGGAYNAWDNNSSPPVQFTSGSFSGYFRCVPVAALLNTTTVPSTTVRVYVSQETVLVCVVQGTSLITKSWVMAGAIIEPWTTDTTLDAETDNRVYGILSTGSGNPSSGWASGVAANDFLNHGGASGNSHNLMFIPGTSNSGSTATYAIESELTFRVANTQSQSSTMSGATPTRVIMMGRTSGGAGIGRLRELYHAAAVVDTEPGWTNGDDLFHVIGFDSLNADDAFFLRSV